VTASSIVLPAPTASASTDAVGVMRELVGSFRYKDALDHYRRALRAETDQSADVAILAVIAAARTDALDLAADLAQQAWTDFTHRGDTDGRMRAANLLGATHFKRGRLDWAQVAFSLGLRFARQLDDTLYIARTSNNLATIADLRGQPRAALPLYQAALAAYSRLGDVRGTAETYHNLSLTFRQLAQWDDAQRASEYAIHHAAHVREYGLLALAWCGQAELYLEQNDVEFARQSVNQASEVLTDCETAVSAGDVQRLRALIALRRHDFTTARECAENARETAETHGNALLLADASGISAVAHRRLGLEGIAAARHQRALEEYTNIGAIHLRTRFVQAWTLSGSRSRS
jgi:tetratricopeptide (TPR) repeat protein